MRVGLQKISHSRSLHRALRLQVEQQEVELPSIEGLIFINIPRCPHRPRPPVLPAPCTGLQSPRRPRPPSCLPRAWGSSPYPPAQSPLGLHAPHTQGSWALDPALLSSLPLTSVPLPLMQLGLRGRPVGL